MTPSPPVNTIALSCIFHSHLLSIVVPLLPGLNRENTYYTAIAVPPSILVAVLTAVPLAALNLSGFTENNVDDDNISSEYSYSGNSIWVLRVFGTLITPFIAAVSYYLIDNYTITQKVSDQINAALLARNKVEEKEFAEKSVADGETHQRASFVVGAAASDVEKRAVSMGGKTSSQEEVDEKVQADRLVMMHLSLEEIDRVFFGVAVGDVNSGLLTVFRYNAFSAFFAGVTSGMLLAAFFVDATLGKSHFCTLLLALFILLVSFFLYELLRFTSVKTMFDWPLDKLKEVASAVRDDFGSYQETLREKLARGAIDVSANTDTAAQASDDTTKLKEGTKRPSLIDPIQDVVERENAGEASGAQPTRGYKRIFSALLAVLALAIIVICLDVA